jgi:hypothetical protein
MQPTLEPAFVSSPKWQGLSPEARSTLQGLLQFVTRKHCDWVVEATPKQIGDWIGSEAEMQPAKVVAALRELTLSGCLRRGQSNSGTKFIVAPSCVDR